MDAADDFRDWQVLLNSENASFDPEDGAINSNYFSADPQNPHPIPNQDATSPVSSQNASWLEPEPIPNLFGRTPGPGFSSDDSVDGPGSFLGSEVEVESPKSVESVKEVGDGGDGREGKGVVWWKLPFEAVKLFVFKVNPVWSISVAVAVLGFLVLGRRLYRMKYKSRSLAFKIGLDAKKASQLKVQAARLNEASSIVKRAPMVRPTVSAGGLAPWPVLAFQ